MLTISFHGGALRLTVRYVKLIRGIYHYRRRIPRDLLPHYPGKEFVKVSLRTRDAAVAAQKSPAVTRNKRPIGRLSERISARTLALPQSRRETPLWLS